MVCQQGAKQTYTKESRKEDRAVKSILKQPSSNDSTSRRRSSISFSDNIDTVEIPALDDDMLDDMFYLEDELANFKYEAFMEMVGLKASDFEEGSSTNSDTSATDLDGSLSSNNTDGSTNFFQNSTPSMMTLRPKAIKKQTSSKKEQEIPTETSQSVEDKRTEERTKSVEEGASESIVTSHQQREQEIQRKTAQSAEPQNETAKGGPPVLKAWGAVRPLTGSWRQAKGTKVGWVPHLDEEQERRGSATASGEADSLEEFSGQKPASHEEGKKTLEQGLKEVSVSVAKSETFVEERKMPMVESEAFATAETFPRGRAFRTHKDKARAIHERRRLLAEHGDESGQAATPHPTLPMRSPCASYDPPKTATRIPALLKGMPKTASSQSYSTSERDSPTPKSIYTRSKFVEISPLAPPFPVSSPRPSPSPRMAFTALRASPSLPIWPPLASPRPPPSPRRASRKLQASSMQLSSPSSRPSPSPRTAARARSGSSEYGPSITLPPPQLSLTSTASDTVTSGPLKLAALKYIDGPKGRALRTHGVEARTTHTRHRPSVKHGDESSGQAPITPPQTPPLFS